MDEMALVVVWDSVPLYIYFHFYDCLVVSCLFEKETFLSLSLFNFVVSECVCGKPIRGQDETRFGIYIPCIK